MRTCAHVVDTYRTTVEIRVRLFVRALSRRNDFSCARVDVGLSLNSYTN